MAAVLVFPTLFFPGQDPAAERLKSFATFALAFIARPIGSALFGHFGDRVGRKATLVTALLTMGVSTVSIGLLPTYASIGVWAPALLALCRFGQGSRLGRRMGRCGAAGDGECAARKARLVWKLSATGSARRIHFFERRLSVDEHSAEQRGADELGVAGAIPGERRVGVGRAVCAVAAGRDTGIRAQRRPRRAGPGADRRGAVALFAAARVRHAGHRHHLSDLLFDDGVRFELGDHRARIRAHANT